ncbi:hypothetical protein JZ751_029585, partial [Albula glossodonta]
MASVILYRTQITDKLLIGATVNIQWFVVMRADLLLQVSSGLDQFVLLKSRRFIVRLEVSFAVRGQTHQTGPDGFELSPSADITRHVSSADITRHVSRSSVTVSRRSSLESCLLQFLHHFSK